MADSSKSSLGLSLSEQSLKRSFVASLSFADFAVDIAATFGIPCAPCWGCVFALQYKILDLISIHSTDKENFELVKLNKRRKMKKKEKKTEE